MNTAMQYLVPLLSLAIRCIMPPKNRHVRRLSANEQSIIAGMFYHVAATPRFS